MDTIQLPLPQPEDPPFNPVAHSRTRAQALADGALIDVTETSKEVGFKVPVTISEALHNRMIPTKAEAAIGQDYDSRLWDVLWVAAFTIKLADRGTDIVTFTFALQETDAQSGLPQNTDLRLRIVCGSGDEGEPVVTIGFPEDY